MIPQQNVIFITPRPLPSSLIEFSLQDRLTEKAAVFGEKIRNWLLETERTRNLPKPPTKAEKDKAAYIQGNLNKQKQLREEYNARIAKIRKEEPNPLIRDRLIAEAKKNWLKFIEKQPYYNLFQQTTEENNLNEQPSSEINATNENNITSTNENKLKPTDESNTQ